MGMLNDRQRDRRSMLLVCAVVAPIVALGYNFGSGYAVIIVLTVLLSWFQSSSGSLADAFAIEIANKEGFSFGSVRLWGALSFSLGTFVTGFAYEKFGYDKSMYAYFALSVFVVVTMLLFPKMKPGGHKFSLFHQTKRVLLHRRFMLFVGISFLLTFASAVNFYFLPIYFKEMAFDKSWIGTAYTIAALIEVPMFWLSARLNRRIGRTYMLAVSALAFALKCLVLAFSHHVYIVLAVQLLDGISYAFFAGAAVETVDALSDEAAKATFQTVYAAVTSGLGGIIGTAAGGVIVDLLGAATLYLFLFVLCLLSAVGFVAARGEFRSPGSPHSGVPL
ncbi:hypothetical protein SD70_21655 [Gordoniibacillus kamchatkensis]|uniref:Major facilitator superfamily (MFS) profile domain-containing protein n=2 Tax=Gordoniibacillus kamchatkensis TaxID=1590651 RepID=A0ABR5AF13_9BACL|nr:hypothetical protein SD70_21655 [Paenibacillus sp. VKM B-2647]